MSGRIYTVSFDNVTVGAVQDLIGVYAGANMAVALHSFTLGQITSTAVALLRLSVKRLPATVTSGSGGSSFTPVPVRSTNPAATFTARVNDTTQATTGGTASVLTADAWNLVNGWLWLPPESDRFIIAPGQAGILSLNTAPSSSLTVSGSATVEELF